MESLQISRVDNTRRSKNFDEISIMIDSLGESLMWEL